MMWMLNAGKLFFLLALSSPIVFITIELSARGLDTDSVADRILLKQLGCSKTFRGANTIPFRSLQDGSAMKFISELAAELLERVDQDSIENGRIAKNLVASVSVVQKASNSPVKGFDRSNEIHLSKQCLMPVANADVMTRYAEI